MGVCMNMCLDVCLPRPLHSYVFFCIFCKSYRDCMCVYVCIGKACMCCVCMCLVCMSVCMSPSVCEVSASYCHNFVCVRIHMYLTPH
ncbi:hypothetical protein EON63_10630 [archaeon]|nr:MAG: hypothetical protein EON63_10630 [archaeon]